MLLWFSGDPEGSASKFQNSDCRLNNQNPESALPQ